MEKLPLRITGLIISLLVVGATNTELRAQRESTSQKLVSNKEVIIGNQGKMVSLAHWLTMIEQNFQVTFLFKDEVVQHKWVNTDKIRFGDDAGQELWDILDRLGLTYRRVDEQTYVLLRQESHPKKVAMQEQVSGTVTDGQSGETLPGVNIKIKGTTTGTATDASGQYELSVESLQDTLVFSFVGYQTQQVPISGRAEVDISMKQQVISGKEMVVVGYGEEEKSNITGSISSVSSNNLSGVPTTDPLEAIEGQVPGVRIFQSTGQPGNSNGIRIHGTQSINGTNSPIYVVDGVIQDGINNINPDNIETISVLKDAASTAIYGARAANGVILVTTKSGSKSQKPIISFKASQGYQGKSNLGIPLLNRDQWVKYRAKAFENIGTDVPWTQKDLDNLKGVDINWPDLVQRTGYLNNYNISASGGDENSTYFISAGYWRNKGRIIGQKYNKANLRIKGSYDFGRRVTLSNSINFYSTAQKYNQGWSDYNIYRAALRLTPLNTKYKKGDTNLISNTYLQGTSTNPLWAAYNTNVNNNSKGVEGSLNLNISLLKGLNLEARGSIDLARFDYKRFRGGVPVSLGTQGSRTNEITTNRNNTDHWIADLLLRYNRTFKEKHSIRFLAGYSVEEQTTKDLSASGLDTPSDIPYLNVADPNTLTSSDNYTSFAFQSEFGRIRYTYNDKYIINATVRRDGSSRLAEGHKYGIFPSVSAAWRVKEEPFMANVGWISALKLRLSYGKVGNVLSINPYGTSPALTKTVYVKNETPVTGYTLNSAVNEDVSWEETTKKNIGIDLNVFNDRIYITTDVYIADTHDLLFNQPIPYSTGLVGEPYINAGHIRNSGVDLRVGFTNTSPKWSYDLSFNLSHNKNNIKNLGGRNLRTSGYKEGYPTNTFFGYLTRGLIRTQKDLNDYPHRDGKGIGDIWIKDVNGRDKNGNLTGKPDGQVNEDDRVLFNKAKVNPTFIYGFNSSVSYKNLTLAVHITAATGFDRFMLRGSRLTDLMANEANQEPTYVLDSFNAQSNADGAYPIVKKGDPGHNRDFSSFWLRNASYLDIKNVNVRYELPKNIATQMGINQLSLFGSIQNVWSFRDVYTQPNSFTSIPIPRIFTFGAELKL